MAYFFNGNATMNAEKESLPLAGDALNNEADTKESITIPVIQEEVVIDKTIVETGRIHIQKQINTRQQTIDVQLMHDEYSVEHVPLNKYVDEAPPMRHEGNTTIIPVLKEVMVKRILVVEEIHITKHAVATTQQQDVQLRTEEISIRRSAPNKE